MALSDALAAYIEDGAGRALVEIGQAWAAATQDETPVASGALKASVHFEMTGAHEGALVMKGYGRVVAIATPALSTAPRNVRARARYARKVGRKITHPNPFYERAWQSERVQAALEHVSGSIVHRG